jgi:nucleolar protein 58
MLLLFETSAGYALFKVLNEKALKEVDNISTMFDEVAGANKM